MEEKFHILKGHKVVAVPMLEWKEVKVEDKEVDKMFKALAEKLPAVVKVRQKFEEVVKEEIVKAVQKLEKEGKMNPQKVDRDFEANEERYDRWRFNIRNHFRYVKQQDERESEKLEVPHDCDTFSRWLEVLGLVDDERLAFDDWVELDVDANGSVWLVRRCD